MSDGTAAACIASMALIERELAGLIKGDANLTETVPGEEISRVLRVCRMQQEMIAQGIHTAQMEALPVPLIIP